MSTVDKLRSLGTEAILIAGRERHVARGHLLALDGVRGLAILMVIGCHAFESDYESRGFVYRVIGESLHYGNTGVDLFFVLSGFLITGILFDSLKDDGYFRKFYARRALRILPLYYGVLLVCLLLTYPLHLHWGSMGWLLLLYLQNLRPEAIAEFAPGKHLALYHFWSLAVEEQFYLVWPAVVFWVRTRSGLLRTMLIGSAGAVVVRVAMLLLGASTVAIHETTICRADSLLLGGVLALLYRSPDWQTVKRWAPWACMAAVASYGAMSSFSNAHFGRAPTRSLLWSEGLSYTVLSIGFACLIAWSLMPGSVCSWIFQRGWLRFLGKYSYGLYVLHVLVLSALAIPLRMALLEATHNKAVAVVGAGLACFGISIVAAYASYHLYEKHFLKLKHHFDYSRKTLNHGSPDDAFTR
ncbi:acyltransferase [Granulicella sp. L46]|uniref:acyltransferase family protein n=1 Tax=Granulicella sp. L46 TaxID=1641865 RepID=UPI00131CCCB5|nr:acyltransferase [Granulicella sp. L46]